MNSEIKFRLWNGNEMVYFGLFASPWPLSFDWPVMRYTGLKDKNGKEIYEGDVLQYGKARAEVKYDEKLCVYHDVFGLGFASFASESEVVGDIYSNPDLIK